MLTRGLRQSQTSRSVAARAGMLSQRRRAYVPSFSRFRVTVVAANAAEMVTVPATDAPHACVKVGTVQLELFR